MYNLLLSVSLSAIMPSKNCINTKNISAIKPLNTRFFVQLLKFLCWFLLYVPIISTYLAVQTATVCLQIKCIFRVHRKLVVQLHVLSDMLAICTFNAIRNWILFLLMKYMNNSSPANFHGVLDSGDWKSFSFIFILLVIFFSVHEMNIISFVFC